MKQLKELTQDEYKKLKKSDMLTILYPEATGDYEKDKLDDCTEYFSEKFGKYDSRYHGGYKPTYKVGDWVVADEGFLCRITEAISRAAGTAEAMDVTGRSFIIELKHAQKADSYTVEAHLIEEAKRRGYKKGVSILDRRSNSTVCTITSPLFDYKYNPTLDRLSTIIFGRNNMYDAVIYSKGEWAEIINDEAVKIGGYDVEFLEGSVKIGCKTFRNEFITDTQKMRKYVMSLREKGLRKVNITENGTIRVERLDNLVPIFIENDDWEKIIKNLVY